jgi:dipeptidyl aminopeptidase/acylaminoacyl peptidase
LTRLGFKRDGQGLRHGAYSHLWVFDLAKRRVRQLTSGEFDDSQHDWSPDSRHLVFVSNRMQQADVHLRNSDVHVVSVGGGRPRQLTRQPGPKSSPVWSPDGRTIAYLGHARWPDTVDNLHVWSVPARRGPARDLMPDADLMCDARLLSDVREHAEGTTPRPVWSPDARRIYFVATRDGATNVWEIDASGGAPRQRTFGQHEIPAISSSRDGRRWAFVRITPTSPGEVHLAEAVGAAEAAGARAEAQAASTKAVEAAEAAASRAAGTRTARSSLNALLPGARVRALTHSNAAYLARRRLVVPQELRIPCDGGHEIQGWVMRAPGRDSRRPAILMIHGGPYAAYGATFLHEFQLLASHGYHVAYANLRGSAGYGREFMRALVGRWGHVDHVDLMRVTDVVEALPFVDRARMAVAGGSYGGYLAVWAIAHTRRYACSVAMRGAYNHVSLHGTGDLGSDLSNEFEAMPPWESHDRWWRSSPLAHVEAIRTPLLLLHAEEDLRCPVSQAEELFTALRVLERDVELVRFLGDGHELSRGGHPHNRVARLQRLLEWYGSSASSEPCAVTATAPGCRRCLRIVRSGSYTSGDLVQHASGESSEVPLPPVTRPFPGPRRTAK